MKYLATLLAAAGLVAGVALEDYFPQCSIDCLVDGVESATSCDPNDGVCVCVFDNYVVIVDAATACVMQACGSDVAVNTVLPAAADFCSAVSSSASLAPATSTAAGGAASTSASAVTTSVETSPTAAATGSSSGSEVTSAPTTASAQSTAAPSTTASPAGAADSRPAGIVAMLALGALAAF